MGDVAFWDFGAEITSMMINAVIKLFSFLFKLAVKIVEKILASFKGDPQEAAKRIEFEAKYPVVNPKVVSSVKRGVFFGTQYGKYIVKPEETGGHVLVCGGTGTDKSSCIAIPTLQSWQGSVFAIDIKGELYQNTKQHRKNIRLFDPEDKKSRYVYDSYFFLKESNNPAPEALAIAQAIIPLSPEAHEPFWVENAQILLMGAILHYYDAGFSFIDTLQKIKSYSVQALVKIISKSSSDKAKLCVKSFGELEDKVIAGINAEINRCITLIVTDDNIVRALTYETGNLNSPAKGVSSGVRNQKSDSARHHATKEIITPWDLENGVDVYLKIPEYFMTQWKHLLTLMVNQFITFFQRRADNMDNRPILFLLDEFPRLGKMPAVTDALATLRSKKITACIIIQSIAQLDYIYRQDARKIVADNCAFKAVLGATDPDTQEYFSRLAGTFDKIHVSKTRNKDKLGAPSGSSESFGDGNDKRIIKPEEFATLQEIILLYPLPCNFCRVKKKTYYLKQGERK